MPSTQTLITLILTLIGGAAVIAAMALKQPVILLGLFLVTGGAFAVFANRQAGKARDAWTPDIEDDEY